MQVPISLSIWLKQLALPLGLVVGLGIIAYLIVVISATRRRRALSRERDGVTEESFVAHLAQYNFDPLITGTTYRYLQQVQRVGFPIMPSDELDHDLGLGVEDVQQAINDLLGSLKRAHQPGLRYDPVITVEDLARHLQASPRIDRRAAAA
jgi:hypothetical protein